MSSDMGSMQELDPERGDLRLLAWRGLHPESAAFWEWVRFDSASTCGQALSSGHRVIVSDIEACDWMAGTADLDGYRRSGIRAVQSTPLLSRSGRLHKVRRALPRLCVQEWQLPPGADSPEREIELGFRLLLRKYSQRGVPLLCSSLVTMPSRFMLMIASSLESTM